MTKRADEQSNHGRHVRILHVEDNPNDRELIAAALHTYGFNCQITCVIAEKEFREALELFEFDLILSDFTLPSFDGASALAVAKVLRPEVPFLFVSGTIGAERAVESLKDGATDYVLKDHLKRLGPAVRRALREAQERTERLRAEQDTQRALGQLRASEERFRQLAEYIQEVFWITDAVKKRILYISPGYEKIWGRSCQSLYDNATSWLEAIHPEDRDRVWQAAITKQAEGLYNEEYRIVRTDMQIRWIQDQAFPVHNAEGQVERVVGIARDITERKQAEKHIRHLNRVYAVLGDINQTIVREKDDQKMVETACSIAVEKGEFRMAWIGRLDPLSKKIRLAASAGAVSDMPELLGAMLGGERHDCNCAFTLHALQTGEHGVCNDIEHDPQAAPWRDIALQNNCRAMASLPLKIGAKIVGTFNLYAGDVDFFDAEELRLLDELAVDISFALDVHEREIERWRIEEELRWKTTFLEAQVHSALSGVLVVNGQGRIILRNQRFVEMWQIPAHIVNGSDDAPQLEYAKNRTKNPHQFAEKVAYLYAHPHEISRDEIELADGRVFDRYSAPVQDKAGNHYGRIWTFRDISKEKQAEAALRRSEAQLRATFEGAALGIALVSLDGRPVKCNLALTRMLGYSEVELRRLTFSEFTHPEDVDADMRLYRSLLAGERDHYEIEKRYLRKDGQIMWGRLTVSLVERMNGLEPLAIGMVEDITARHKLEEQFRQVQKMEAIGQLAGGVAHDFNNILAVIQLQSGLLGTDKGLSPAQREVTSEIVRAAERAANLTRQLLLFSRRQAIQPGHLDLNETVVQMTKMLQRILGEDISLSANYASNLPVVHADTGMIEQVLLNLAVNSRDAMPNGGKLIISTDTETLDANRAEQTPNATPGVYVRLSVTDTGCGIPPEILPRIFEPFFTTKEVGKGTGLGLATVYGIVQQHRGWINVTSELNHGATFHIYFPAVAGLAAGKKKEFRLVQLPRGTENILLVEDELAVRLSVSNALQHCGYTVLRAESGVDALKVWQEHKERIHLVLTDVVMPDGLTGFELARRLQAEKPQLKVIYASGYIGDLAGKPSNLVEGVNFLQKPFAARTLAEAIRKSLDHGCTFISTGPGCADTTPAS